MSAVTCFANSAFSFGALRFLLGIGEGFNWPGASKAGSGMVSCRKSAAVAVAIFDSGSSIGGAVAANGYALDCDSSSDGDMHLCFPEILGFCWLRLWLAVYPRINVQFPIATRAPPAAQPKPHGCRS